MQEMVILCQEWLQNQKGASEEQVLSLFEPHTLVIAHHKDRGVRSPSIQHTLQEVGVQVVAGMAGLQRWLGWSMLARNIRHVAQVKVAHSQKRQRVFKGRAMPQAQPSRDEPSED